jgi:hypothetical protein
MTPTSGATPSGRSLLRKLAALVGVLLDTASVAMFIAAIWVNSSAVSDKLTATAVIALLLGAGAVLYYEYGGPDA